MSWGDVDGIRGGLNEGEGVVAERAFGPGDADWSDWQATRAGVRCAAAAADVTSIITCCENAQPGTYKDGDPPP